MHRSAKYYHNIQTNILNTYYNTILLLPMHGLTTYLTTCSFTLSEFVNSLNATISIISNYPNNYPNNLCKIY